MLRHRCLLHNQGNYFIIPNKMITNICKTLLYRNYLCRKGINNKKNSLGFEEYITWFNLQRLEIKKNMDVNNIIRAII